MKRITADTRGRGVRTPWGDSEDATKIADGIVFHSTCRHGGLALSVERQAELRSALPGWQPFGGNTGWLEEDCDWALAGILWPSLWTPEEVFDAVRTVRDMRKHGGKWIVVCDWLETQGAEARAVSDSFSDTVAGKWERGGGHGSKSGWTTHYYRDGKCRDVVSADYPTGLGRWLSTDDLDAFRAVPA